MSVSLAGSCTLLTVYVSLAVWVFEGVPWYFRHTFDLLWLLSPGWDVEECPVPFQEHGWLSGYSRHCEFLGTLLVLSQHICMILGSRLLVVLTLCFYWAPHVWHTVDNSPACSCVVVVSHEFAMGDHFAQDIELQLGRVVVFTLPPTAFFILFSEGWTSVESRLFQQLRPQNKLSCFLSSSCLLGWWSGPGRLGLVRPKISVCSNVIFWFCRLRLFRFALNYPIEIFTPYGLFPP